MKIELFCKKLPASYLTDNKNTKCTTYTFIDFSLEKYQSCNDQKLYTQRKYQFTFFNLSAILRLTVKKEKPVNFTGFNSGKN